jgi:hypothetical protein
MNRRNLLAILPAAFLPLAPQKRRRFKFKIKTTNNTTISVTTEGRGVQEAQAKVMKRYPGCTILRVEEL